MTHLWRTIRRGLWEYGNALVLLAPPLSGIGYIHDDPWTFTAGYLAFYLIFAGVGLIFLAALMWLVSPRLPARPPAIPQQLELAFRLVLYGTTALVLTIVFTPAPPDLLGDYLSLALLCLLPPLYLALLILWLLRLRHAPRRPR